MDTIEQIRTSINESIVRRNSLRNELIHKARTEYLLWLIDAMESTIQDKVIQRGESFFIVPELYSGYNRISANCDDKHELELRDISRIYLSEFNSPLPVSIDSVVRGLLLHVSDKYSAAGMKFYARRAQYHMCIFCDVKGSHNEANMLGFSGTIKWILGIWGYEDGSADY